MSYNLKITVYNNRDYEQPFVLQNSDTTVYDLTGCKLAFGYSNEEKTLGVHQSDLGSNKCIFITNAATGQYKLVLPYSVLKTLEPGNYTHDLIVIDAAGKRTGVWAGTLVVKKGIA